MPFKHDGEKRRASEQDVTHMNHEKAMEQLRTLKTQVLHGGGLERTEALHRKGRKTARQRVVELLDQGTFVELDMLITSRSHKSAPEDERSVGGGVITGYGKIAGRDVYVFAQDSVRFEGPLAEAGAKRIVKVMDLAMKNGAPIVGIQDSGLADTEQRVPSLGGYAEVFFHNVVASGVIPQISAVMGPCVGEAVYAPAMTDFIIMVKGTSHMFVNSPASIQNATGETVSGEDLGGALTHSTRTGVAHLAADDEEHCLDMIRALLSYLPQNNLDEPPRMESDDPADRQDEDLDRIVPGEPGGSYSMHEVIARVVDHGHFFEIMPYWAQNLVVGFARLGGRPVGIVANEPASGGGALDNDGAVKGARFVRFCDAFNVPLVVLEDVPGFVPGAAQEHGGLIRNGAKLLYAFCEATVPKITVITRHAGAEAYDVMCSKHARADLNFAWPSAEFAISGAIDDATLPLEAAALGYIDDIIEPRDTRPRLISALEICSSKREGRPPKKHGNIPL
jgi:propionyl-CoA carboxylase beta chain